MSTWTFFKENIYFQGRAIKRVSTALCHACQYTYPRHAQSVGGHLRPHFAP